MAFYSKDYTCIDHVFFLPPPPPPPPRWVVLKDSYLAYVRSDRHSIAGVLLFDHPMTIEIGISRTGVRFGLKITTQTRCDR